MPSHGIEAPKPSPVTLLPQPQPEVTSPERAAPSGKVLLLSALATAGLLWLSYFPVACGWLAWFALVPLLGLVRTTARRRVVYPCAWLAGLAFYWPALQWMRVADDRMYFTWAFLSTYCALYFPLEIWLLRLLERRLRLPLLLTLPVTWTALEYFRSVFGTGFSWYLLGHSQHDFLQLIQISDVTGAYGVSFLVAAANAPVFEGAWALSWFRRLYAPSEAFPRWSPKALLVQFQIVGIALLATLGYGSWRLHSGPGTTRQGPTIALIQGNLGQGVRNASTDPNGAARRDAIHSMESHYATLCNLAAIFQPDLIIWPETSLPEEWEEIAPDVPPNRVSADWRERDTISRSMARNCARKWPTNVLLGLNATVLEADGRPRRYNSALLIGPEGKVYGRYDKIHRVPFGEYVPLRDWLPWMDRFAPYDFDYSVSSGKGHTRFPMADAQGRRFTFGAVICYEDTDPDVVRPYGGGDGKPPADFILNISNDGWFNGTSEHEQHLAICRFRAIECRRNVARSVNMGISAVIDGSGRVWRPEAVSWVPEAGAVAGPAWAPLASYLRTLNVWRVPEPASELPMSEWKDYKKVAGVLLATMPLDHRASFYARWGDWLPWSCWALLFAGLVGAVFCRRLKRDVG
jgi:apolipoprotein N-acyltransferase